MVSDQAVAIGVTAVPTPDTDRGSDLWYVFEEIFGEFVFISGVGTQERGQLHRFDSKAMRKVEDGQDIITVAESPNTSAKIQVAVRCLIKLH